MEGVMDKRALVVSGGGSKGAFAVGALKYLMGELGVEFDVLAGTSTGALITPMIAAKGKGALPLLETEYTTVRTGDILGGNRVWRVVTGEPSFYTSDPLRRRIERHVTHEVWETLRTGKRQLAVTTVDLRDGRLVYYQTGAPIATDEVVEPVHSRDQLIKAILSSASIPVAMPPVVNARAAHPQDGYVDGGVREYVPIEIAIDAGATDICCIVLAPPFDKRPPYEKRFGNVFDVLQRTIDLLSEEVGASDLKLSRLYTDAVVYLNAVRRVLAAHGLPPETIARALSPAGVKNPFTGKVAVSLRVIRPERMLAGGTLEFTPADMKANLEYGYQCAKEQWEETRNLMVPSLFPGTPAGAAAAGRAREGEAPLPL